MSVLHQQLTSCRSFTTHKWCDFRLMLPMFSMSSAALKLTGRATGNCNHIQSKFMKMNLTTLPISLPVLHRTDRHFMLPYATYNSDDLINVQPDSGFVRRCPAIKVPMYITSDDRSSHSITWLWTWIRSADWMMHQWNIQMVGKSVYGLPYGFNNFKV